MKLLLVAGARPNYMKIAPIYWASAEGSADVQVDVVHTGQHYDPALSEDFFRDLHLPAPTANLGVGSGSHAEQTAKVMVGFETLLAERRPDVVVVVGDVNSTAACSLVTAKAYGSAPDGTGRPLLAHVEAGLRSRDRTMPEEVNRLVTDALSDILFTTSPDADENLRAEGIPAEKIDRVGNTMIDSVLRSRAAADTVALPSAMETAPAFGLCTLHRPSNVDDSVVLTRVLEALREIAKTTPLFLPLHPRTRDRIERFDLGGYLTSAGSRSEPRSGLHAIPPLGYLQMIRAQARAAFVLTDSGGIQEETTALGVPCVTIRENTERPITISQGTNVLAGTTRDGIVRALDDARKKAAAGRSPELWDGHAGTRILDALVRRWAERGTRASRMSARAGQEAG